ncbi:hypothetical protein B296_00039364 [Ensete ventricosum]|uniref:Uncharacterized protein n=1 Tax=Ensete ventricosum TaxID=4639 RepID=A0A426ZQE8_ENSVE|nr:hypothetical protein B296_00039364 [Ensete ventricosum]
MLTRHTRIYKPKSATKQTKLGLVSLLQARYLLYKNCLENTEVLKKVVERGEEATMSTEGLSYPNAKRCSKRRWTRRSATVSQRRIYRSRRNGRRCKATDSRAMGLTTPWFRRGRTSVESSIPCSYGGRVLVVKGGREGGEYRVKLKYQDKAKGRGQGTS